MNQKLLERVELMKAAVRRRMKTTLNKSQNNYDKKVPWKPQVCDDNEMYIDRPKDSALTSDFAKELAQKE